MSSWLDLALTFLISSLILLAFVIKRNIKPLKVLLTTELEEEEFQKQNHKQKQKQNHKQKQEQGQETSQQEMESNKESQQLKIPLVCFIYFC